jgi:hypothetical protein
MPEQPKYLYDGFLGLSGGVDSGRSPTLASAVNPSGLQRNQAAFAINTTMRGDRAKPRPGYKNRPLTSFTQKSGRFQGATFYNPDTGNGFIVASVAGHILKVDVLTGVVQDISVPSDLNANNRPLCWMYQAENFLIIQDGLDGCIIFDGSSCRRSGPNEIPGGRMGAYSGGRIWQVLADGKSFMAGDLIYGDGTRANVLRTTENTFLNEGGVFTVPQNAGKITALLTTSNLDTSLGQGPLLVFTENTVFSVNAPFDRTTWKDVTYPIQTVSLVINGATGFYSTKLINGDPYFRASDGVRSFIMARRSFGQQGNTPQSREMNRVLPLDDQSLLEHGSAVIFDNRLLMTTSPVPSASGVYHRGLVVLDFDLVSGMRDKSPPAWEGIWTDLNFLQVVTGKINGQERCWAFVLNSASEIELWEITRNDRFDSTPDATPIKWVIETASYPFNTPFALKRLTSGDIWIDRVAGQVDFDLKFRPDQHPCWVDWYTWSECATYQDCDIAYCAIPKEMKEQYRPRRRFIEPPEDCNAILNMPFKDGFEFQARLAISGFCEIKQVRLQAIERPEMVVGEC